VVLAALLTPGCAAAAGDGAMRRVAAVGPRSGVDGAEPASAVGGPDGAGPPGAVELAPPRPAVKVVAPPTTVAPAPPTVPPPPTLASSPVTRAVPVTTAVPATTAAPVSVPAPPPSRSVTEQPWTPFAAVGGVTLVHPADRVERVGFHQSNHDGARQLDVLATAVSPVTLESRSRATEGRTAADVVVDPSAEIRSPVSGRVLRAGTYVLYCEYSDDYAVVEPDQHPGWEVKLLHIDGVRVRPGDRVVAGETVVAGRATQLPFESQVDKVGAVEPVWPHVHIEVVDPSIPDRPSPGGGCD
jgi:biotin carboxyl carrier protein